MSAQEKKVEGAIEDCVRFLAEQALSRVLDEHEVIAVLLGTLELSVAAFCDGDPARIRAELIEIREVLSIGIADLKV